MAKSTQKDVIYIDTDDEITSIIDKVTSSEHKIAALVLPKRLPALQSIVNMKLLKQSAQQANKSIVLISSSTTIMPFAGAVGLHVAKTLQSKPEIPEPPKKPTATANETVEAKSVPDAAESDLDATKSVGELAAQNEIDSIQVEDKPVGAQGKKVKGKSGKKAFKIPNFNAFRLKLALGVLGVVLLIAGWVMAFIVMPRAEIVVRTNTDTFDAVIELTANTLLDEVDQEASAIPAELVSTDKTDAETVDATGEKNVGKQATGVVVLKNCRESEGSVTIPAGTGVSAGNFTYITSSSVTLPESSFTGAGTCKTSVEEVAVVAQKPGEEYNLDAGSDFTVAGYSNITGENEEDMKGGTTDNVKVVQQSDIDAAKQAVLDRFNEVVKEKMLADNNTGNTVALKETFKSSEPVVATNHKVDDEADSVTVTVSATLTIMTVSTEHIEPFVEPAVQDQIDSSQQSILDNGLSSADYTLGELVSDGEAKISVATKVTAGPELSEQTVKNEVIGKKKGEAIRVLEDRPGVDQVDINYSPFWIYSTPSSEKKITVVFEQSNAE